MKYSVYCNAMSHRLETAFFLQLNDNLFFRFTLVYDLCVMLHFSSDFNSPLTTLTGYCSPYDSERRI
jgi:hypothetical protein